MLTHPIITLTTDFGIHDPFVGVMKGVISGINPSAHIVDISHAVTPYNIYEASQIIAMSYKYFPPTTIHLAVVDPGVGSMRRPILVVTEDYYFIGPDNGIFTPIFEELHTNIFRVVHITSSHYYLPPKGPTFHGRDIFAPAAAWLSKGIESTKFGEEINDYVRLRMPELNVISGNTIEGEVIYIDNFGNAITNITQAKIVELSAASLKEAVISQRETEGKEENYPTPTPLPQGEGVRGRVKDVFSRERLKVILKGQEAVLSKYYSESEGSVLSAILNSTGLVELFTYRGNACDKFNIRIGDKVSLKLV